MQFDRESLLQSALFAPLNLTISRLEAFPTLDDLNALVLDLRVSTQSGSLLRFVPPGSRSTFENQYEPRCYLKGEVETREENWHDLFNALVWLTFPVAKAAINARHYRELMSAKEEKGRGAMRDLNTLLDESGVIVAFSDESLAGLIRDFKWRELFWQRRAEVKCSMGFYLFGHGLYEKAMKPYVGMTGQGLLVEVDPSYFSLTLSEQIEHLDDKVARYLDEQGISTRELAPVPLLGVPGWSAGNECASYYDNTDYFRPGRRMK